MKWNNLVRIKILLENIEENWNSVVEYFDNKYDENFIKEKSSIGIENGEGIFLIRTYRKINEKDLLILKEILGKNYISATVDSNTFSPD